jgi:DNA gyrase subunit A
MAIRFHESDARAMGRAAGGVRGIRLTKGDHVVGMVVADPAMSLLTVCENGYGKRTPFGVGGEPVISSAPGESPGDVIDDIANGDIVADDTIADEAEVDEPPTDEAAAEGDASNKSYRRQRRGGKGIRDIRTTDRNGPAVKIAAVTEGDEVLLVTTAGKIQRLRVVDINEIGRNTQGVRIMRLDKEDKVASLARIPADLVDEAAPPAPPPEAEPTP